MLAMPSPPRKLAAQTYLLSEFLVHKADHYTPPNRHDQRILLHGHCHQKPRMTEEVELLRASGAQVELLDSGCCGMAGPFGFEKEKYSISTALANRVLMPAVERAEKETVIVTNGFSCREQIAQLSNRRAVHLSQVLARNATNIPPRSPGSASALPPYSGEPARRRTYIRGSKILRLIPQCAA